MVSDGFVKLAVRYMPNGRQEDHSRDGYDDATGWIL